MALSNRDRIDRGLEAVTRPEPLVALPRQFYGVVELDPVRFGGNAGQIGQEIVQHLASIMGANVEIKADVPERKLRHNICDP
jgi:hypothetical protein